MKKLFFLTVILLCSLGQAEAADQYGGFEQNADSGAIKPFCRDLGGVLGSATFHGGRTLGVTGWDAGIRGGLLFNPQPDNRILRNNGVRRAFALPWVQAEVGMPFKFDGFVRGISYEGLTIAGGGLRYGLLKSADTRWAPQLLVSGSGHSVVHQHFSASHFGASLVGSIGIPMFTPYLGAGFDRTRVVVRSSLYDPFLNGKNFSTLESRFTAGMRFRPWPFFYINLAGILVKGRAGGEAGLGLRF